MRNVVLRASLLVVLVVGAGVLGIGPASAHAALVGSDPENGASFTSAPAKVTFTFSENVGNGFLAVTAPDGSEVAVSDVKTVDHTITATVADVDQRGRYTASYRVVSADGHPVSDSITYDVTTGRTVKQAAPPAQASFVHRHSAHLFWGILAAAVAVALLLAPLRRRDDKDSA